MSFELQIREFAEAIKVRTEVVLQKVSLDVFRSVVLKTPVDTGRARGNWLLTIGAPASGTTKRLDKTGSATISEAATKAKNVSADQTVYITNNLPYIKALENGKSKQAPHGMVAVTMSSVEAYINKAIREAKK